ncbi:MAG: choice-of-anchor J domain-containing protein [Pseudobacter sp.]|uniref:choice-of-anchor J domain-containing protein n=1 Tax=Pseudobacter sp. TaxID=2045420 RepID=UPI003F81AF90
MTLKSTRTFLFLFFLLTLFTSVNRTYAQAYNESFNNVATLAGSGWIIQNNSAPLGPNSWYQGVATTNSPDPGPFNANSGAANAYIAANFASTTGGTGIISNWLITPNRVLRNGDVFTFYTRKPTIPAGGTDFPDRLEVRMSTNGASTNTGTSAAGWGDFSTLLLTINPTLVANVYPQVWTQYTITISGLPAPTSGRIAFRYFVTGAGPSGSNSDYIGIDDVAYTPYICPSFTMSPASGALPGGKAGVAYSQSFTQTGALGAPNYAIVAGALPPGLTLSATGTISGTPTATGTFNFTVMVGDASGCSHSQAYSITTLCPDNPVVFPAAQVCGNVTPVDLAASPAGGSFSGTGVSSIQFDPAAGTQTITYDYTDPYGCAHARSAVYTVVDPGVSNVTPTTQTVCSGDAITAIAPSNTAGASFTWTRDNTGSVTGINASGSGSVSGTLVNTTASPVTVTFTLTSDKDGCTIPVTSTVLVNPAPAIQTEGNKAVNNTNNTCNAEVTYNTTATGVPAPTVSYSFSGATTGSGNGNGSGSLFNVGVTTVTVTATNSCGTGSSSFTVTVNDTQKPTITCPAPVTVSCTGDIPVPDISTVTASDNCSGVTVSFVDDVISNQTCANRYTVTRTYRATDNAGNSETCTQIITVNDQTAPVITCPANIAATNAGSCNGAAVSFTVNATDNCGGNVTVTTLPESGSLFQVGVTTVTATATDACGNQSTCTFTVTISDVQTPVITAQPANQEICTTQDASFSITASNVVSYQWQRKEGNNWEDISNATNSSFTVPAVTLAENGNQYRVVLTGNCTSVTSEAVSLTIKQLPAPTITIPAEICVEDKNIQLQATPAGGIFSGPGVTGTNWNLETPSLGNQTIHYTYTDPNGCSASTSKIVKLNLCNSSRSITMLYGYPNPSRGKVTVKALITIEATYSLVANDISGRPVLRKNMSLHKGWNLIDVDLTGQKAGMYILTLGTGKGKGDIKILKID